MVTKGTVQPFLAWSTFLGSLLLGLGIWLATVSGTVLLAYCHYGLCFALAVAVMGLLISAYRTPGALLCESPTAFGTAPRVLSHRAPFKGGIKYNCRSWLQWLLACLGLSLFTLCYFQFLEKQTQIDPRLYVLATGTIVGLLHKQPFALGLLPWLLYGVLGVGLAYVTLVFKTKPFFIEPCLLWTQKHPQRAFFRQLIRVPLDIYYMTSFVLVASFMTLWAADNLVYCWAVIHCLPDPCA